MTATTILQFLPAPANFGCGWVKSPLQCWQKKTHSIKMLFLGPKKCFMHNLFFSCLKMVIFELMILDLGDILGWSLLRNFFIAARSIIFWGVYISVFLFSISGVQKLIQNHQNFAMLSFNINFNLFESCDIFIFNFSILPTNPTSHPNFELVSEPSDIKNKTAELFTRKY